MELNGLRNLYLQELNDLYMAETQFGLSSLRRYGRGTRKP
jgi:hypothetical protein